jgi:hypothetical protein
VERDHSSRLRSLSSLIGNTPLLVIDVLKTGERLGVRMPCLGSLKEKICSERSHGRRSERRRGNAPKPCLSAHRG